jgi:hypothetical protein
MRDYPTPNVLDTYTRAMTNTFDEHELIGLKPAFLSFFGQSPGSVTRYMPDNSAFEIQLRRIDGEKRAKLKKRGSYADSLGDTQKQTDVGEWTDLVTTFPLAEESGDIHAQVLDERYFGEEHYKPWTKLRRLRARASDIHRAHVLRLARMMNWLASKSILDGQQPIVEGASAAGDYIDFYRNSNMTVTLGTAWTGSTNPIEDIDDGWEAGRQYGKVDLAGALMGEASFSAFYQNSVWTELANNRRLSRVRDNPDMRPPAEFQRFVDAGFTYQARLITYHGHKFEIFTYGEQYETDTPTWTKFMPTDQVLLFNPNTRADRYFGPSERLPMDPGRRQQYQFYMGIDPQTLKIPPRVDSWSVNFNPRMFHFDMRVNDVSILLRSQVAPIYAPYHTDAFYLMKGVA